MPRIDPARERPPARDERAGKALQPHPLLLSRPKSEDKSGGHSLSSTGSGAALRSWSRLPAGVGGNTTGGDGKQSSEQGSAQR